MLKCLSCTCLFLLISHMKVCYNISIKGVIDPNNPGRMLLLPNMKNENDLRSEGIFERFIRRLLDLLTTSFPEKRLPKYCRILSRHIYKLNYKYAKRLAKHLKHMSQMYQEDVKSELLLYNQLLEKKRPNRTAFFDAINTAFTLQQYMQFEDYVYELKNYGSDDKLFIDEDTEKVLQIIMGSILQLSASDRKDIVIKLRHAIKEFVYDLEHAN